MATVLPVSAISAVALTYAVLAILRGREARGWSRWRTGAFLAGCGLLALGLVPQLSILPSGDFRGHMVQHLLIGMYAPTALVLGAPITLLLRSVPPAAGRAVGQVLRSRLVHVVANPATALILSVGMLYLLYLTPLYSVATSHAGLHGLLHLHVLLAGCLFAWVIAGPDPAPRRPTVPVRLGVLGVAIAGHAVLSQLMYAGLYVDLPVPPAQRQAGAELMYYGGDVAELLLALALVTSWRPHRRKAAAARADRQVVVVPSS